MEQLQRPEDHLVIGGIQRGRHDPDAHFAAARRGQRRVDGREALERTVPRNGDGFHS